MVTDRLLPERVWCSGGCWLSCWTTGWWCDGGGGGGGWWWCWWWCPMSADVGGRLTDCRPWCTCCWWAGRTTTVFDSADGIAAAVAFASLFSVIMSKNFNSSCAETRKARIRWTLDDTVVICNNNIILYAQDARSVTVSNRIDSIYIFLGITRENANCRVELL